MKYTETNQYKPFEYINEDLDLLLLLVFLETYKGKNEFLSFENFYKGDFWNVDDVKEEILDAEEYHGTSDMVMEQLVFMIEQLQLGEVLAVGIDDTRKAIEDLLIEAAKIGQKDIKGALPYLTYMTEHIYFLDWQEHSIREAQAEKDPKNYKEILRHDDKSVFFSNSGRGHFQALQPIAANLPNRIVMQINYKDKNVRNIEKEIASYLGKFSNDQMISELPKYQSKRLYFLQQIENFCRYVNKQQIIGNTINIPFTILIETDFEAVKILAYLQLNNIIKMRWSDEESWRIQFNNLPITPESLLNPENSQTTTHLQTSLKTDLSFDEAKSILTFGDIAIKIRKGSDQYHFLRIIFKDKQTLPKEWFYSEIAEEYDYVEQIEDKKFYNAAYQINQKIIRDTGLKDVLLTTTQSVRINPKYLR